MIADNLSPNTATFNTVIAALSEGRPTALSSSSNSNDGKPLWEKALSVFKVMRSKHAPHGVKPNRQTYNILIKNLAASLQPGYAESLLDAMRKDGFVPDVDLYTLTVRSYERCGNPIKALSLMESMNEVGYQFYEMRAFNEVFKNGVKILNKVAGKDKTSKSTLLNDGIDFDEYGNEEREQLFNSWR
jgi:pentatricopeptide repeat protein